MPLPGGLPIGVQLIAAPGREDVLFRVADALERSGAVRSPRPIRTEGASMLEIDIPEVVAEVEAVFRRYEQALVGNDVAVLAELFWHDPRTIRFGVGGEPEGLGRDHGLPPGAAGGGPRPRPDGYGHHHLWP